MKKRLYILSFFAILSLGIIIMFTFNSINNQEKVAQEVIGSIYSNENLNIDIDENLETKLKNKYLKYFTDKGFDVALANRVFTSFPALLKINNIKNIECLNVDLQKDNHHNEYNYTANLNVTTDTETVTETITGIIRFENSKSNKINYISHTNTIENKVSSIVSKEKNAITSISIKNKNVDFYKDIYDKTLSEKLETKYNLSSEEIQSCLDNSHFEVSSYEINFVKSFDDHQVKVPANIPFDVVLDVCLWKCEDYMAVINIENVSVNPKNDFEFEDEKNEVQYWFEYFDGSKYNGIEFDYDNIFITTLKEPTQLMIGFHGLEVENTKNNEVYKNFPIYVYFSVSNYKIL